MNNKSIVILVLVVVGVGAGFFLGMKKKAEAPGDTLQTVCTMEAKLCPDGSYVGRSGPKCEFVACPGASTTSTQATKEFTVKGTNFAFEPSMIKVKKGDKVKITFQNSAGFHNFVINEYGVATKQAQSPATEVIEFTANKTGSFEYYCSVKTHRQMGMKGTLVVE